MEFKLQIKSGRYDDTEVIRQINILRQIESTSSTPKKYAKLKFLLEEDYIHIFTHELHEDYQIYAERLYEIVRILTTSENRIADINRAIGVKTTSVLLKNFIKKLKHPRLIEQTPVSNGDLLEMLNYR